jgi:hypothetical protein
MVVYYFTFFHRQGRIDSSYKRESAGFTSLDDSTLEVKSLRPLLDGEFNNVFIVTIRAKKTLLNKIYLDLHNRQIER